MAYNQFATVIVTAQAACHNFPFLQTSRYLSEGAEFARQFNYMESRGIGPGSCRKIAFLSNVSFPVSLDIAVVRKHMPVQKAPAWVGRPARCSLMSLIRPALGFYFPKVASCALRSAVRQFPPSIMRIASDPRMGSAEEWVEYLDRVGVDQTVMLRTEGLSVAFFQQAACGAFDDYAAQRYGKPLWR